jgi:hypothetical protein
MKHITLAALAGAAMMVAGPAVAQQNTDFSKVEIKTTDLGNKTYMLQGQGGNITVAVGTDGIIMVDSEFAPLHDKIKAAIEKISPLPISISSTPIITAITPAEMHSSTRTAPPSWRRTISGSVSPPATRLTA